MTAEGQRSSDARRYESASQFSREFKRYFVCAGEDAARMRAMQGN